MALTTLDDFINIYCVEDGMLANAENVNRSPIQLKKELENDLGENKDYLILRYDPNAIQDSSKISQCDLPMI